MKILIAQTNHLGDLVLTLPMIQHLHEADPAAEITVLVSRGNESVVRSHPAVSKFITYDRGVDEGGWLGAFRLGRRLKGIGFDTALVLPGSVRTALAVFLARIPRRIGTDQSTGVLLFEEDVKFPNLLKKSPPGRLLIHGEHLWAKLGGKHSFVSKLFTEVVQLERKAHAAHRHMQMLNRLGISTRGEVKSPSLFPTSADIRLVDELVAHLNGRPLVAIAPGSKWPTKRWPVERFTQVAICLQQQGHRIALIGGKEDQDICREIVNSLVSDTAVNASGKLDPLQSSELLRRCTLLLTNDSAPVHLAAAAGTRCVALFGPTIPGFGFTPLGVEHVILEHQPLWCRPCTPHGGETCPITTHACMASLSVEQVLLTVNMMIAQSPGAG